MSDPIIVIGGGPAGSVCGGILASHGFPVRLFEKDSHPRHHVGESLQPATIDILDAHLGVAEELSQQCYAYKYGAVYIWGESREPWQILFDERLEQDLPNLTEEQILSGDYEHAWQVHRSSFDDIIHRAAKRKGVLSSENCAVETVLFEDDRAVGVRLHTGEEIAASYVVDASGQRCMIGRQKNWVETVTDLKSVAIYSYFTGTGGLEGPLSRHVQLVVTVPNGWLWFIPVSDTVTSIGLVTKDGRRYSEEEFFALLEESEIPFKNPKMVEIDGFCGLRYARDWSYACRQLFGENYLLVGDAAMFVDPILSGGVDFAVRSAANAALAILQKQSKTDANAFAQYQQTMQQEYQAYLRMARYWYGNNRSVDGFFWEAHQQVHKKGLSTPVRAFVYLTSGRYNADQHFKVFQQWQEELMFQALGVDKKQLGKALQQRRT